MTQNKSKIAQKNIIINCLSKVKYLFFPRDSFDIYFEDDSLNINSQQTLEKKFCLKKDLELPENYLDGVFLVYSYNPSLEKLIHRAKYFLEWDIFDYLWHRAEQDFWDYFCNLEGQASGVFINSLLNNLNNNLLNNSETIQIANQPVSTQKISSQTKSRHEIKALISFTPSDKKRFVIRGFHGPKILAKKVYQSLILAKKSQLSNPGLTEVFSKINFEFGDLIQRKYSTKARAGLNRKERLENLEKAFIFRQNKVNLENVKKADLVILVDDVCTTGSTLNEAAKTLKTVNPKLTIYALALAG